MSANPATDLLDLLDWRRRIAGLYAEIRATSDRQAARQRWGEVRAELFRHHPQSPVPPSERSPYSGPHLYQYDPAWSTAATVRPTAPRRFELRTSQADAMAFTSFGHAHFTVAGIELGLELYWLEGYGGGLFVPFADATSGLETYGAGRYLLDSVKGADLGQRGGLLVLDFNFAYQPSCSYDPRWACPLAPPANRLPVSVRAGERYTQD
ncbi:MAG: DUF1684 domain-containing protein [Actinomycetota bacterium]|nr:DUF1684 domain-containing protein [Actinomycetota bacterium]